MKIQNFDHRARHEIYTGQSGTGKTTLCTQTVLREKAKWKFVFDGKGGEIGSRFKLPSCYDGDGLLSAAERGGWVIFNPMHLFPGRFKEGFDFFCKFVWQVSTAVPGRKILFTDELHRWTHKHKATESFQTILDLGRSFCLDTFSISTRPNALYTETRAAMTHVYAFRQVDGNATEFLKEAGIDEKKVRELRNGEFLWRNVDTGDSGQGGKAF